VQKNDTAPAAPVPDGLPAPQRYWAMAAIILGISLSVLDASIVNLALPDITRDFGASPSAAVWVVNAYQLATLGLLLPCAHLGDRFGYRRVYLVGLVVFILASLACVMSSSLLMLAAARALQGMGAAGLMSVNSALVRLTYPANRLGRAIALNSVVVASSSVAGPSIAALILSVASWPWLFVLQLPLGIVVWWVARRSLPRNRTNSSARLSPLDVALNILMFVLLFLGADALGARSGGAGDTGKLLAAGALLLGALAVGWFYLRRQLRQETPLFRWTCCASGVRAVDVHFGHGLRVADAGLHLPALPAARRAGPQPPGGGLLVTAWPAAIVVAAPIAGRLIHRVPADCWVAIGLGDHGDGPGPAGSDAGPADGPGHRLAARAVRHRLRPVPVAQQPHHRDQRTAGPRGAASGHGGNGALTGQSLGA
jgi:DHA2 family multidrug resistance protein-like MFS transporter